MKRNAGFTLIELVIVIIVLGILAATAVPKFINLQDDAKKAAMKGAESALHSAANIVFSKSAIDGIEKKAGSTTNKVGDILVAYGFPTAAVGGIDNAVELSGFNVGGSVTVTAANSIAVYAAGTPVIGDVCIIYKEAASGGNYTISTAKFTTATLCGDPAPDPTPDPVPTP